MDVSESHFDQTYPESFEHQPQSAQTGIAFDIGFFPLGFFLFFCTPVLVVNGVAYRCGWGKHYFDLQPGQYHIKFFFPYLFMSECGANAVVVDLHPGNVRTVQYYMWPLIFVPGTINVF